VQFIRQFDDFSPADGWIYTIYLNGLTVKFNKAGVVEDDGVSFLVTFLPSDTEALAPGPYRYCERLTNPTLDPPQTFDVRGDELVINVEPDAASSPAGTYQTFEEKTLAVIEAAIAGNLTGGIQSYQIAGRAVSKYNLVELTQLRGRFRAAVWRQQNPGHLGVPYEVWFDAREETRFPPTWVDVTGLDR
jgi:hypothetical protein